MHRLRSFTPYAMDSDQVDWIVEKNRRSVPTEETCYFFSERRAAKKEGFFVLETNSRSYPEKRTK